MVQIKVQKEPDGWKSYIKDGHKLIAVDGFFEHEDEAVSAAVIASKNLK